MREVQFSLGVYRYLLKPIAFDELENIASAVEKLEVV